MEEHVQSIPGLRTMKKEGVESFIEFPIRAEGNVLGIVQLADRSPRKFKPEEVSLLETIGNQMGVAVQKAQLYEETRRQALELEKASKMQADFTAMIVHDLRSPLNNIIGTVGMMEEGLFGPVNQEQKKWLGKIGNNVRNLVDLTNDVLDLSKLETGHIDIVTEDVDLGRLIRNIVDNYTVMAQDKKKIRLWSSVDPALPQITADARRLDQVLSNLLSNAMKFTGEGGEVEVGGGREDSSEIKVWVRDTGVGIPSEELPNFSKNTSKPPAAKLPNRRELAWDW